MQPTDAREGNDPGVSLWRPLHRTPGWCVLLEREMRSIVEVVDDILGQQPVQVTLVEDHDVIQELPLYGSDPAFDHSIGRRIDFKTVPATVRYGARGLPQQ